VLNLSLRFSSTSTERSALRSITSVILSTWRAARRQTHRSRLKRFLAYLRVMSQDLYAHGDLLRRQRRNAAPHMAMIEKFFENPQRGESVDKEYPLSNWTYARTRTHIVCKAHFRERIQHTITSFASVFSERRETIHGKCSRKLLISTKSRLQGQSRGSMPGEGSTPLHA
jgi:hypothetical protein